MSNDDHQQHPTNLSAWPENAMSFYLSGYLEGIERGRALEAADTDRAWAPAYATVQAAARTTPHTQHWAAVKARQIASCEAQKCDMVPWPDEATP